ncbi:hypothetical protein AAGV33_14110 [Flavobacterium sp. FBOR7N2.3]|uniref:Carboxypeptidase-like regulatory domain-containing protein n=1 Tax=Flavobacterium magnesitis TaxID=3138077 RepID=A0ABV4TRJ9_9FLAO
MKYIIALQIIFICSFSYAQNFQIQKLVVDKNTKAPLENVIISNENDNSITNSEGKFLFVSQQNEINLNLLGYNKIKTTFEKLKNEKDTIFMEIKTFELREVVISNTEAFMKKVYDKFQDNLLQNYTLNFFLRNVFKKDQVNILLQDIYARKNKNASLKNNLTIEILNMRKTSLFEKKDKIHFQFPDFDGLFHIIVPQIEKCNFVEIPFNDNNFKKIIFKTNERVQSGQIWTGYFIINRKDYAVVEYSLTLIDDPEKIPYKKILLSKEEYRTTKWTKFTQFTKDSKSNKYYPSNIKIDNQVEMLVYKESKKNIYYDFTMDFFATNSPTNEKIKSNFVIYNDIFRAKFPYSKDFWNNQNQLPLTLELEQFLNSVSEKKDKTKEFEIISNF